MHGQNALVLQSNIKTFVSAEGDWSSVPEITWVSLADFCQLHAWSSWRVMRHMADVQLRWTFAVNQHADGQSGPEPVWTYRTRNHHNRSVCVVLGFVLWHLLVFGFVLRVVVWAVNFGVILIVHSGFFCGLVSLSVFAFKVLFVSSAGLSAPHALLLLLTFDPRPTGHVLPFAAGTRELVNEVFHASWSRQIGPFSVLVLHGDAHSCACVCVWSARAGLWDMFVVCSLETHHWVLKHTWSSDCIVTVSSTSVEK